MKKLMYLPFLLILLTGNTSAAVLLDKVVAIVNKEVITWSDLYKGMEFEALDNVKNLDPKEKLKIFKENEHTFLETMIDMRLQLQEAERRGITVSKDEVQSAIEMIRNKYGMSREEFEKAIAQEGFTFKDYQKRLLEQMLLNRIVDQEVRNKIIVSEGDIDTALKNDRAMLKNIEGYVISIINLGKTGPKDALESKAKEVIERFKKGESFADLARQYSTDPSAKTGGTLGFVGKGDISPQLIKVLEGLRDNEVSEPFWTEHGLNIVLLHHKREVKGDKDLREAVRQRLTEEQFNRRYRDWLKGLRERSYVEIKI
jgi:peptidyl-prolyl cis-trans isomerase SurA